MYVNYSYYNRGAPKVVLLCQHGSEGREFLVKHRRLLDAMPRQDKAHFEQYLKIEQDFGTHELAHALARILPFSTGVIDVHTHRGVLDANRIPESAVARLFDHATYPELVQELLETHGHVLEDVARILQETAPACVLDVHSMSPFTPRVTGDSAIKAVKLEPGKLGEYNDAWVNPLKRGERRHLDIITELDTKEVVGTKELAEVLARACEAAHIPYRHNHPYPISRQVMTVQYVQAYRGVAVDIPKDYLADGPLDNMIVSVQKIMNMAKVLVSGLTEYLERGHS